MRYAALGAAPATAPSELESDGRSFERAARRAATAIGYNVLFRRALPAAGATALDSMVGPAASPEALVFAQIVKGLDDGKLVVQPYTIAPSLDVQWGVTRQAGAPLGWWPLAVQVLKFAGQAAMAAAGFVLVDGYNTTTKLEAEAKLTRANTERAVTNAATELQQTDPAGASKLLAIVAKAQGAAESGSTSLGWLDTAGRAALGIGTGALLALGAFYFFGRRSSSRKRNPRRRR